MEPLFEPNEQALYEHTSIPLAIYYVEDGQFYAYLVSDGGCEMYEATREEMIARLNGPNPFINVTEKEELARAVGQFARNDAVFNVVFHERMGKSGKIKTIHCVGRHEYTRDGRRYSVVRYDEISDSSRQTLFHEQEQMMAEQQKLLNDIDDAIARSFTSVIYVETADQSVNIVRLNRLGKAVREGFGETAKLREVMDGYVKALVYKDDAAGVLKFGDFDHVMELLKETNPIFHTYRTIRDGRIVYYRLKIIPFDDGKKLIYGFEHFDDQVREQLARKSELETQMTLLAGLSCEYESIWLVDAAIHHGRLIRTKVGKDDPASEMYSTTEGIYETLIGNYIDKYVVAEDRERVYMLSSIEHLIRNTKEDEIFHINYSRIDPEGNRNYLQLAIARVMDDMGVIRFVCGFRNIDAIIEEEKNRNMLYSMAHIDNMTGVNNRRTFDEYMDSHSHSAVSDDLMFFSFDLNELKEANDSCGHEAGDELIIGAAKCMKDVLGECGNIYRTGGDEFAAVVKVAAEHRSELVAKLTERFNNWQGELYPKLSISMGYVCRDEDTSMTLDDLRREAEKRMYSMKSDYYMQEGNDRRRPRGGK